MSMHIILTHEQADFDALAAVLGASLLDDKAIPVLPRRMNRNLRTFISLYGSELPFVEPRELPSRPINQVMLVDTQSLVTLKGLSPRAGIQVIDHHTLREDLPPDWKVSIEPVGACTTVFVEQLQKHSPRLSTIAATMMLLGIYEDTGALTYTGTTPRDVRAAAFLLEQGASLQITTKHINPPLTADQRAVFDRLLSSAETLDIRGQTIIITKTHAEDLIEEVSSIVHKMRDLLEPDGLFVLVSTSDGIRLVARSTTDRIDVSRIAAFFGGGGHSRASAALIHPVENEGKDALETVYSQLVDMLPGFVTPPVTVGQIMSRGPLVLSPQTPVTEAALLMQRYGYEGYPVVEENKVIGLLTRRAVDRAQSHKLKVTAGSLMEAGEVTVSTHDSVEHLQHVMNRSGWGQVPVVIPETGEIIGIVTRTDLLKTLALNGGALPGEVNLSERLAAALPPTRLALLKAVAAEAYTRRQAVYIVGGFVRDLILARPAMDFDIVVEGDAISLARALAKHYGGRVTTHSRFGTAKWRISEVCQDIARQLNGDGSANPAELPESLDLITARTEFYDYPTALPTVERSSIKLDLHRRDFTMNTIALRLDGKYYGALYDYWGGLGDLRRGLVRVLHSLSFIDDPTRMLRAVRFEQRFGFKIEPRTLQLMEEAHPLLRQVSGDRLRHELNLILMEDFPEKVLARLETLNLLRAIHPHLSWSSSLSAPLQSALKSPLEPGWQLSPTDSEAELRRGLGYIVWLGRLPEEVLTQVDERLRFPAVLRSALIAASRLWPDLPALLDARPSTTAARFDQVPLSVLYAIDLPETPAEIRALIQRYVFEWRQITPVANGKDLQAAGLKPGPAYNRILKALRTAWLDGEIRTRDEESAMLDLLVRGQKME